MKYTLIKGTFHVVGFSPDGDSMMFKAANPAHWSKLGDENRDVFAAKLAASENGAVQLRLQGIDALETHYSPEPLMTPADVKGRETSLQNSVANPSASELAAALEADRAENLAGFAPRPAYRPLTKFENRGLRLGHGVWDVIFRRKSGSL